MKKWKTANNRLPRKSSVLSLDNALFLFYIHKRFIIEGDSYIFSFHTSSIRDGYN